jgi:hypothetical protein
MDKNLKASVCNLIKKGIDSQAKTTIRQGYSKSEGCHWGYFLSFPRIFHPFSEERAGGEGAE